MTVGSTGVIRGISANPKGLLEIRWSGIDPAGWHLNADGAAKDWLGRLDEDQKTYLRAQLAAIPRNLAIIFKQGASVDGIVLNDMHAIEEISGSGWQKQVFMKTLPASAAGQQLGIAFFRPEYLDERLDSSRLSLSSRERRWG